MRINELKTEYAKTEAITEYISLIGYEDFCESVERNRFWQDLEAFKCGLTENGSVCPPDNFVDLADEIHLVMGERDIENVTWLATLIENGLHYIAREGYTVTSIEELAEILRKDNIGFDSEDGTLAYIG